MWRGLLIFAGMILIAPDKFKGSLTAGQVCEVVGDVLRSRGFADIAAVPMADGGEGTPAVLGGRRVIVSHDHIGPQAEGMTDRGVMHRSSAPLGRAIAAAGPGPMYVGIGGTATCDGGAGMLAALGARFFDSDGREMTSCITPAVLPSVVRADLSALRRGPWCHMLTGLADVRASLLPPGLSALDFAAQKGAAATDMPVLAEGLASLRRALGVDTSSPYDGAGGGVGFALATVIGAEVQPGAEVILDSCGVDWPRVSFVITGEGRIDEQTAGGKVVDAVVRRARRLGVPSLAIGGYAGQSLRRGGRHAVISTVDTPGEYVPELAAERLRGALGRYLDSCGPIPAAMASEVSTTPKS